MTTHRTSRRRPGRRLGTVPRRPPLSILAFACLTLSSGPTLATSTVSSFFALPDASSTPQISFQDQTVTASGLSPKSEAVWLSVWREGTQGRPTRITRLWETSFDEDGDGTVELHLERPVPWQSIWIVLGLETGEAAVAVPEGYRLWRVASKNIRLVDSAKAIDIDHSDVELTLVRPGTGAWHSTARASPSPVQQGHKPSRASFANFQSHQPGRTPPSHLQPGDVLGIIDVRTMRTDLIRISK